MYSPARDQQTVRHPHFGLCVDPGKYFFQFIFDVCMFGYVCYSLNLWINVLIKKKMFLFSK